MKKEKVLVLDDQERSRKKTRNVLKKSRVKQIAEAEEIDEAVGKYLKQKPDFVLLSFDSHKKSKRAVNNLLDKDPGAKIYVVSNMRPEYCEEIMELGAVDYYRKPLNRRILEEIIFTLDY